MYVAVGGVLVALFGLLRMYLGAVFVAALVSVVGVVTYLDAKDRTDSFGADCFGGSIGWGLFVVIGGGVAAVRCWRNLLSPGRYPLSTGAVSSDGLLVQTDRPELDARTGRSADLDGGVAERRVRREPRLARSTRSVS